MVKSKHFIEKKKSNNFRLRKHRKFAQIIRKAGKQFEQEYDGESIFDEDIDQNIRKEINTRDLLRSWANCHGITTRAINDLLKILILAGNEYITIESKLNLSKTYMF